MTIDLLLLPFFQRALAIGLILGVLMAALGVLVVLRRMSFFADAVGHSALTGIAIGLLLGVDPFLAALAFALFIAALLATVKERSSLHIDTLLGVFFPAAMALGVILVQLTPGYQTDLLAFLFGDILIISTLDLILSLIAGVLLAGVAIWIGKQLILIAFSADLAHTEGIPVKRYDLFLMLSLAAVIALSVKFIGIILVTAMLVIPAATAQNLATSVWRMLVVSVGASIIAVVIGMLLSAALGLPSGPAIVLTAAALFALSAFARGLEIRI